MPEITRTRIITDKTGADLMLNSRGSVDFGLICPMPDCLKKPEQMETYRLAERIYAYLSNCGRNKDPQIKGIMKELFSDRRIGYDPHLFSYDDPRPDDYDNGRILYQNFLETGYFGGYLWTLDNWGVYSNAVDTSTKNENDIYTISFDTPWNAPWRWFEKLADKCDFDFVSAGECLGEDVAEGLARSGSLSYDYVWGEEEAVETAKEIFGID